MLKWTLSRRPAYRPLSSCLRQLQVGILLAADDTSRCCSERSGALRYLLYHGVDCRATFVSFTALFHSPVLEVAIRLQHEECGSTGASSCASLRHADKAWVQNLTAYRQVAELGELMDVRRCNNSILRDNDSLTRCRAVASGDRTAWSSPRPKQCQGFVTAISESTRGSSVRSGRFMPCLTMLQMDRT